MTEKKKPQAKEWWRTDNGEILFFVGCTSGGDQSWEDRQGCFIGLVDIDRGWQHLPECDGFDWVEQKWPKYYVDTRKKMDGFFRRDSESSYTVVRSNGKEIRQCGHASVLERNGTFVEITKPEALARLDKKCPDCGEPAGDGHEDLCPEAWVEHEGAKPRNGIDQYRWGHREWAIASGELVSVGGDSDEDGDTLHVRCRRKDLPVAAATEQPKRREMTEAERQCPDVPQGFFEITDSRHVLRNGIDYFQGEYGDGPTWDKVETIVAGETIGFYNKHDNDRYCCHVSDAPQAAVTASDGELDQFLPSTQQAFDDLHRRCSDLAGQVDRMKREVQTVVGGVEAAQDRYDRSLPVTVEWLKSLKSVGFEDARKHRPAVQMSIDHYTKLTCWTDENKWTVSDNFSHEVVLAECVENRGRVIDLLKGLGIEVKVATSNLSATSSCGKWAMDQA